MQKIEYVLKHLPLSVVARDPDQPRKGFAIEDDGNKLLLSIQEQGIECAIAVTEVAPNRYVILDGHRRYLCAQKLNLATIPCRVYPKLEPGELSERRFNMQNNRRAWKPMEKAEAIATIKKAYGIRTSKELATRLYISEWSITSALELREQKVALIELMAKYGLQESYQNEFVRLKKKLWKIGDYEIDDITRILFEKVKAGVIKNSKEFRTLRRIFLRPNVNEEQLARFLSGPEMTVAELDEVTLQTGSSLLVEKLIQEIATKRQTGVEFAPEEKKIFSQLKTLLAEVA